jgi:AraC family transcriptional regulator, regulatory protein of adaptative response / methylated-DNA-[protein]-cysteine methyltransferase
MIAAMSLDFAECNRARLARDPKFDGRFYTGVRTTGIYCRPVCPVRPARSANVSFFPSAAAAEAAGFRPCLRCRPETAPFSGAWKGSRATVERALRLIVVERALDGEGTTVERLAARLGMGTRQLTRLFARHLHASPSQVARTARLQRAKRLLDESCLPMADIAMRAGFGSLRRFNSVFAEVYGRPPTEIRVSPAKRSTRVRLKRRCPMARHLPMLPQERQHRGIERVVECRPVAPRVILAQPRLHLRQRIRARREERVVPGVTPMSGSSALAARGARRIALLLVATCEPSGPGCWSSPTVASARI